MTLPSPELTFRRMIDSLEEAASCSRQLAFLRQQPQWLQVDEKLLAMRRLIIDMYEAADRERFIPS